MLEALRLDSEHFALELLPELERTLGSALEGDLRHVRTAGDLFDEVLARRSAVAPATGETPTGMAFYSLRRALVPLWREENPTPLTALADQELPLPKRLKKLLERQTRWELPRVPMSMIGLLSAVTLGAGALYEFAAGQPLPAVALVFACVAAVVFEPGEFSGDWATLGSLAREVTNLNFATLTGEAPDDDEAANWNAFAEKLARHARADGTQPRPGDIGRETLLRFGKEFEP